MREFALEVTPDRDPAARRGGRIPMRCLRCSHAGPDNLGVRLSDLGRREEALARLAHLSLGDSVLVVGLGLIGQICVCLLKAQGCRVFGTDLDPSKLELALSLGADAVASGSPLQAVKDFSAGFGVDAAVLTAATESNEPIEFASEACRNKGRIVLVGVVGLQIPRPPFFKKELEFTVSSSFGPGRMDPSYEEKGIDYPIGYARWTAQRNMQAALELMAATG